MQSKRIAYLFPKWIGPVTKICSMFLVAFALAGKATAQEPPGGGGPGGGNAVSTPEIDPGIALSAITLLIGGSLVLTDSLRRNRAKSSKLA